MSPSGTSSLPREVEVVIVGGGVMGTSIAAHLAAAGVRDVLLLEAHELGSGSSGKPLGGVRAQFSTPANVALGARSLGAFRRFPADFGVDIGLQQVGYLFLLRSAQDVAAFETAIAMQNELGVPSRMIDPAEAGRLNPYLDPADYLAAAYGAQDGYARPSAVVRGYANAAARQGVRILTGVSVTGIDIEDGAITAVRTPLGTVSARSVICAAGAWSAAIGAMAGVHLPVQPLRRQIALTEPMHPRPPRIPFTIDYDTTLYLHPSDDGLLVGLADPLQEPGFDTTYDPAWLPALRAAMARCFPALADVPLGRGWAGLYEMTPDCDAVIGESAAVGRFLYAAGFSGHGFLQAPAVGEAIAHLYRGVAPPCDITPFDAQRFAGTKSRTELAII